MQVESSLKSSNRHAHDGTVKCPLCQWKLIRQRRRVVDRLWSLVQPVRRYRCENFSCQWVGNIATAGTQAASAETTASAPFGDYTEERLPRRVPIAFIVHMVLVAVGVVFVLVFSAMEPSPRVNDTDNMAFDPNIHEWTGKRLDNRADAR